MLALLMLAAGGCSTAPLPEPAVRTEFIKPVIPASALIPCNPPVRGPDRDLTAQEVTTFWGRDRSSLRSCELKRKAVIDALK